MWKPLNRLAGAALAIACLGSAAFAEPVVPSHTVTVDDIVGLEAFGRASLSPDGRWAIYEKRAGYDTMPRVEFGSLSTWTIMDLWLVDLRHPSAPPRRLLPEEGLGLQEIAWSPSGSRVLITRLRDGAFEYGIVSMRDRSVTWTGLTPESPANGASAAWASDEAVLLLTRPDGSLPAILRAQRDSTARRVRAWERTTTGLEPSRTVIEGHGGVVTTEAQEPAQRLIRLAPSTGQRRTLAEGQIVDFSISPDGRAAAVVGREEDIPLGKPELVHMEADRRHRLSIVALEGGQTVRALDALDVAPHLLRWSPDSRVVLVWARRDGARWDQGGLVEASSAGAAMFDLEGLNVGSSTEISGAAMFDLEGLNVGSSTEIVVSGVRADWLGRSPVLLARGPDSDRRDWYLLSRTEPPRTLTSSLRTAPARIAAAGPQALYVFADDALWAMTTTGLRRISRPGTPVHEAVTFDLFAPRRLKANEAPRQSWIAADGPRGESLVLTEEAAPYALGSGAGLDDRVLAVSEDAAIVLQPTGLAEALRLRTPDGDQTLDTVNAGLADVVLTEPKPVTHLDVNGQTTTSWLFLPKASTNGIRGLIVKVYPGWADHLTRVDPLSMTYSTRPESFVAAGYAYLSPSMLAELPVQERGEAYVHSVDLAVDAALEAFPELPANRMVLWGHSFGGYAALEIATRSDRYRSYIASSSYSDMLGVWGEFDPGGRIQPEDGGFFRFNQGWTEVGQGALGAPPWAVPDLYAASSPVLRADRIVRPVLFLTADMDFTPMSQAERMFSAILRNGGDAKMVTYWGEQHLLWSPANIRDYFAQIFDWLARTLDEPAEVMPPTPVAAPTSGPIPPSLPPSE